jgi:hypothetical protein
LIGLLVLVAAQAVTHVHILLRLGCLHLAYIAMTIRTIYPGIDMRLVIEKDELWHDRYRHPGKLFMIFGVFLKLLQCRCIRLDVGVATQALLPGWQPGCHTAVRPRMAVQARNTRLNVNIMGKWKRLLWRGLGNDQNSEQSHQEDDSRPS